MGLTLARKFGISQNSPHITVAGNCVCCKLRKGWGWGGRRGRRDEGEAIGRVIDSNHEVFSSDRDIVVGDEELYDFYDERLPAGTAALGATGFQGPAR